MHNDIKTNTSYKFSRYANIANINNKNYLTEFIIKDNGEVILYSTNIINNNAVPTKRLENNFSTLDTAYYSIADIKSLFKTNLLNKYGNVKKHEEKNILFQKDDRYDWNENLRKVQITAIDGDLIELNNSIKIPKTIIAMEGAGYDSQKIGASFWLDFGRRNLREFNVKELGDFPQEENVTIEKTEHNPELEEIAKEYFGITTNTKVAGYILNDGSMLDFTYILIKIIMSLAKKI